MSIYTGSYYGVYGSGTFPLAPLGVMIELDVGGWTDITGRNVHQSAICASITRGRQNETTQATPSTCALRCDNTDGNLDPDNPVGTWYGLLGLNTPARVSVPDSSTYLRLEDDAVSYISCPDATALQLTGNIDVRLDMRLDDWRPCTLAGKWGGSGAAQAWCLVLNGDGTVSLVWNDGVTVNTAQSTMGLPLGRVMVRCFFDASAGQVVFWTAPDMGGTQTQLGSTVTITAADYAQAAATQAVQVGYVDGFVSEGLPTGNSGLLGKVYEFALYNASAALVADPQFYAQTAGATSFADGQGNTWSLSGTAGLSGRSYRYYGECSSLPQEWDPTGHDVWTPVAASGVLRRIQAGNSPAPSVMRRGITSAASWDVTCYWPCEDPAGSTQIASGLPGGRPMTFTGAPQFQGQSGSPSADTMFACSAQLPQVGTSAWTGVIPPYTVTGGGAALFFLLGIPSGGISANCELLITGGPGGNYLVLEYSTAAGGSLSLDISGAASITGPTGVNGQALWIEIGSAPTFTALNVMPVGGEATSYTSATALTAALGSFIVNWLGANLGSTEMGHFFFSPSPPGLYAPLLNAYSGETAAARFARLCGENSVTARIWGPPDLSAAMGPQPIDTFANQLQYCEDADRGQIFEPRSILGLGYRTVDTLSAQTPGVVADYSAGEVSPPLKPTRDDLNVRNDQVISRNNGGTVQAQVTTGPLSVLPPPDGAGDYQNSLTVYCETDGQLAHIAGWMAWVGTAPGKRYPVILFDLASTDMDMQALIPSVRDADIGDYLQIINTPQPLLPPGDIDQLAWGLKEDIGDFVWRIQANAVPESPYEVMVLDDDAIGFLDTDGSTLHTSVSSTATTLSVATTGATSPLWTAADEPFDILISGEQITVTAITGSSSPQSFTVVRSVNGVSKAQAAGAVVALFDTPALALA